MNTLVVAILMMGGTLAFIQGLHVHKHSTYCKTESQWLHTLPYELRDEVRRALR